jgi:cytoskeleton protein RodZ
MALFQRLKAPVSDDTADDAAPSGPRSAGDLLRQQRETFGLDLDEVAAALRIKPAYLAALEAGRPDQLPGPTYAIGFMRAYAEHLGLDSDEVLRRFRQESAALAVRPDLSFPLPLGERSIPGGGMVLVAIILAICGYGSWYYLSSGEGSRPERVAEVPAALLPPTASQSMKALAAPPSAGEGRAPSDAVGAQSDVAGARATAPVLPTALPIPATPAAAPDLAPATAQTATTQTATTQTATGPSASDMADRSTRIVIRATADSWVQIRGPSRSALVARVLRAGDTYPVPDQGGLSMRTGNAGGLEITVDGSPVPSIGRMGTVRRNVMLDPQALILGSAVRD